MKSIKRRLLVCLLIGQGALLIAVDAAVWQLGSRIIEGGFDEHVGTDVRAIGTLLSQAGPDLELEFSDELMPQYLPGPSPAYFQVWVEGVGVLERSVSLQSKGPLGERVVVDLPRQGGTVEKPLAWDLMLPSGAKGRAVGIHFPVHEYAARNKAGQTAPRARASIVVAVDRAPLDRHLSELRIGIATLDVALILVSALMLLVGVHMGLKPMQQVAEDIASATSSDEALQVSWKGAPRELKPMRDAFLQLMRRVDDAFQREKRLAGNIAHELRTPIAELRAAADVALMKRGDLAALEEAVRTSRDIAGEMEGMVLAILRIWRARMGGEREGRSAVQPLKLLQASVDALESIGAKRSVTVRVAGDGQLQVFAPEHALELAIGNLVRNAMEHAHEGTEIDCSVSMEAEEAVITVRNAQSALAESDAELVREAFWSRPSTGRDAGNCGLGLALVEALSDACGFQLTVQIEGKQATADGEAVPGSFTARLEIPLGTPMGTPLGASPSR